MQNLGIHAQKDVETYLIHHVLFNGFFEKIFHINEKYQNVRNITVLLLCLGFLISLKISILTVFISFFLLLLLPFWQNIHFSCYYI